MLYATTMQFGWWWWWWWWWLYGSGESCVKEGKRCLWNDLGGLLTMVLEFICGAGPERRRRRTAAAEQREPDTWKSALKQT